MCIILSCSPYVRPDDALIDTCWAGNPDGGGYMWADGDTVHVSKGYMALRDYQRALADVPAGVPLVLHMRIGTSGGYGPGATHPYPVCRDMGTLHALDVDCPVGIAHNGVLTGVPTSATMSDTQSYIRDVVAPLASRRAVKSHGGLCRSTLAKRTLSSTSRGSRLALLDAAGHVRLTGAGWSPVCRGIQASNQSWKYPRYAGWYDDTDFDSDFYEDAPYADALDTWCAGCPSRASCAAYGPMCPGMGEGADMESWRVPAHVRGGTH